MCIKEIEGFKVSKMHWVLYSSENPDTFSFHILTCWVDLSAPLKELQGDGLSFAPRNMSWHVPCLHLFQIHLEEQWNWLVWKCLGDPPFLFFEEGVSWMLEYFVSSSHSTVIYKSCFELFSILFQIFRHFRPMIFPTYLPSVAPEKMAEDAFQCAAGSAGKVPPRSRDTRNPSPDFSTLILILGFNDRQVLRGGWLKHVENSINKKLPARNVDTVVFVSLIGSTSTVDNLIQFIKQKVWQFILKAPFSFKMFDF